jgi:thioredoxin reductase (NADPH)
MSEYLVRRLEETPNVFLHPQCEISELIGAACEDSACRLGSVRIRSEAEDEVLDTPFVFLFIGAAPMTDWLPATVAKDERGFLKTGSALGHRELVKARWLLERMPTTYETSLPRVYAVGDVRSGSVKRVASSVGEGSVVVSDIHQALQALAKGEPPTE